MRLAIQQIDAFSDGPFTGNPAAVIVLEEWLSDELMQQIAEENNLAETAYVVPRIDYSQEVVQNLNPDYKLLSQVKSRGVIVTARGADEYDFVSRGFFPQSGIDEDPATGSAHTTLMPFWSDRIGKTTLKAKQLSKRGGYFHCQNNGDRTLISGRCTKYLEGTIII
ncbi:UNVERIFIED_CONTAM: hypothetical protein GTU68_063399 [Idotea baltica]|nr:hypothetical protein [Idotea baltica]